MKQKTVLLLKLSLSLAATLTVLSAPADSPPRFTFTTFDIAGASESLISDIRDDGTLVGRFKDTNGLSHGYVQEGTNLLSFNVTGTTATYAGGMDNFGRVAGFYRDATNTEIQHGFIRETNGTITTLDGPGQTFTYAWRINDAGQVNGYWFEDAPFFIRSYRRAADGTFTTLVYSNSPLGTVTRGMNEAGTLAGWKWDDNFNLQGVIVEGTNFSTVFTVPGWANTLPGDINNLGDIAGTVYDADFSLESSTGFFRRADGVTVTFRVPGADSMEVFGLNDLGQVVGEYEDAAGGVHGFIAHPAIGLSEGHTDIGIAFEDGAFDLHIHDETHDVEYAPDQAVLVVKAASYTTVPNNPLYSFLGLPCSGVWVLPNTENTNLLFLGFGAEEIEAGVFQGDQLRMELKAVAGAGDFIVYDFDSFGVPVVIMSTRDGVDTNDVRVLPAGAHSDFNWAFTQPGYYTVTFEASGTLSNGTFVTSGPVDYTFLVEATNAAPVILTNQHVDIGFAFEDGAWEPHLHNETDEAEYAPDAGVLLVRSQSFARVPDDARFAFLGAGCTPVWILSNTQNTNLIFLGFGAEEIGNGVFQGDEFRVNLLGVNGPGSFFVYDFDSFGNPEVFMNSADGLDTNDFKMLPAGAHQDLNWAFTTPGVYRVTFEAVGTLTNGTVVSSGPAEYTFCVEAGPIPLTPPVLAITQTMTNQVVLTWGGESGALYQLQSTATFPAGWTNVGGPILGVCGTHQVSLPATNAVQFFQIITTSAP